MNMVSTENFATASVVPGLEKADGPNPALTRLMKVWEGKQTKKARTAGTFGLMAVGLAACGGSSDEGDDGDDAVGATFALTIDANPDSAQIDFDNIVGTDGDDTIEGGLGLFNAGGFIGQVLAPELQGEDVIDGGDGQDVLNVVLNGVFGAITGNAPTISNVEVINIEVRDGFGDPAVDFSNISGVEQVWLVNSEDEEDLYIYDVQAPIAVGLRNVDDFRL